MYFYALFEVPKTHGTLKSCGFLVFLGRL